MAKAPAKSASRRFAPDASLGYNAPLLIPDMAWSSQGSTGLRQYGGYVREEFLPQLRGRQAARTYREMMDNSPTVGAIMFAIQQSMRKVTWRVEAPDSSGAAVEGAEFLESCMDDMTQTWPDFISESLSMLGYGFAPHEIVYKRRMGQQKRKANGATKQSSRYDDGKVGWAKLALRGQDTILKWFFDNEGDITGLTQQPWFGGMIDIPIEKLLLFRPRAWKNNPEGQSILRTAYRPWWYTKRLEEQEAVALERLSGTPEYRVPNDVLEAALNGDAGAIANLESVKRVVTNTHIHEQMGLVTPSDTYMNADGTKSTVPMYEFRYNVPQARAALDFDKPITRYKLDVMTSVLADFLTLGHGARGTQSLAVTKVDLFFQATEGWLDSNASVLNDTGIRRLWELNGEPEETMPQLAPDMPKRVDLDVLGNFVLQMAQSGARLFPDDDLENYLRDVADLPELSEGMLNAVPGVEGGDAPLPDQGNVTNPTSEAQATDPKQADLKKVIAGMLVRRYAHVAGKAPLHGKLKKGRVRVPGQ
jgi:hypothetical protein